jgi:hypothetical protein
MILTRPHGRSFSLLQKSVPDPQIAAAVAVGYEHVAVVGVTSAAATHFA